MVFRETLVCFFEAGLLLGFVAGEIPCIHFLSTAESVTRENLTSKCPGHFPLKQIIIALELLALFSPSVVKTNKQTNPKKNRGFPFLASQITKERIVLSSLFPLFQPPSCHTLPTSSVFLAYPPSKQAVMVLLTKKAGENRYMYAYVWVQPASPHLQSPALAASCEAFLPS